MKDDVFPIAAMILQNHGVVSAQNPLVLQTSYSDERIELVGSISGDGQNLQALFINLNLPFEGEFVSGIDESQMPFALPRPRTFETPVYQWSAGEVVFFRPGLWEVYLKQIADGIVEKIGRLRLANDVPVDDAQLFRDIPLGKR
jgi:hypothetical protein